MQDFKDQEGWKWITVNQFWFFVTGGQEIKDFILVEFWGFWSLFCLFNLNFFVLITLGDFSSYFKRNKQALASSWPWKYDPGHCSINFLIYWSHVKLLYFLFVKHLLYQHRALIQYKLRTNKKAIIMNMQIDTGQPPTYHCKHYFVLDLQWCISLI